MVDIYRAAAYIPHNLNITSGPKSNFFCDNIPTKAMLFFFGCSEVNSTWLMTSESANQRARKVLFTCMVYLTIRLRARVFYEQIVNEAQPS